MYHYYKIRDALSDLRLAIAMNHKGAIRRANDHLTKVVRHACGLE